MEENKDLLGSLAHWGETNVCCGLGSLIVKWDFLINKDLVGFFSVVLTDVRNTQSFFVPA